jgi:AbrB family looped-hinge helix DNA binding protein
MKTIAEQKASNSTAIIKMTRSGQITLPAEVRKALQVSEGDYLEAEMADGALKLRPLTLVNPMDAERRLEEIMSKVTPLPQEAARSEDDILTEVAEIIRQTRRDNAEGGAR